MNFVQHNLDLDKNFTIDLIRRDQNKSDQDLNVNEMDFDFDEDFIDDLIRMDQNKSDSVESLPTFYPSSPNPHAANMKHFNYFSPNPPSYYLDPTLSQPFETQQFCDKRNINNHNRTLIFYPNEARIDYTYDHPHQTNVIEQTFRKYVQHTIPDELKNLILETN